MPRNRKHKTHRKKQTRRGQTDYIAIPMALLVAAPSVTHRTAMATQKPLSLKTRQKLLEILTESLDEIVCLADRLVPVSIYFDEDVPAMQARLFLEKLDSEDREPELVKLETGLVDTGVTDDGVAIIQILWVLSVLLITERTGQDVKVFYEMPESNRLEIQQLLEQEIQAGGDSMMCYSILYPESAIVEEWEEAIEILGQEATEARSKFFIGEVEGLIMAAAKEMSEFTRFFPMESVSPVEQILDSFPVSTLRISFYPYPDFLAINGYQDNERGRRFYGEYLGRRSLHIGELEAAARKRSREIEFEDVVVRADDLFAWLKSKGLKNTSENRASFVSRSRVAVM